MSFKKCLISTRAEYGNSLKDLSHLADLTELHVLKNCKGALTGCDGSPGIQLIPIVVQICAPLVIVYLEGTCKTARYVAFIRDMNLQFTRKIALVFNKIETTQTKRKKFPVPELSPVPCSPRPVSYRTPCRNITNFGLKRRYQ